MTKSLVFCTSYIVAPRLAYKQNYYSSLLVLEYCFVKTARYPIYSAAAIFYFFVNPHPRRCESIVVLPTAELCSMLESISQQTKDIIVTTK